MLHPVQALQVWFELVARGRAIHGFLGEGKSVSNGDIVGPLKLAAKRKHWVNHFSFAFVLGL